MSKKKHDAKAPARSNSKRAEIDRSRKPGSRLVWLAGVAATVVAAVVGGIITWIGPEIFDNSAAKDKVREVVRPDDDIRYTVEHLDPGYDLVLPAGVELTAKQREFLNRWSLDRHEGPVGYNLDKLIDDLRGVGGASPGQLMLLLRLESRRNQPIYVDDIRPVSIRYSAPYSGTFLNMPPQGLVKQLRLYSTLTRLGPGLATL